MPKVDHSAMHIVDVAQLADPQIRRLMSGQGVKIKHGTTHKLHLTHDQHKRWLKMKQGGGMIVRMLPHQIAMHAGSLSGGRTYAQRLAARTSRIGRRFVNTIKAVGNVVAPIAQEVGKVALPVLKDIGTSLVKSAPQIIEATATLGPEAGLAVAADAATKAGTKSVIKQASGGSIVPKVKKDKVKAVAKRVAKKFVEKVEDKIEAGSLSGMGPVKQSMNERMAHLRSLKKKKE